MENCKQIIRNRVTSVLGNSAKSLIEELVNKILEVGVENLEDF